MKGSPDTIALETSGVWFNRRQIETLRFGMANILKLHQLFAVTLWLQWNAFNGLNPIDLLEKFADFSRQSSVLVKVCCSVQFDVNTVAKSFTLRDMLCYWKLLQEKFKLITLKAPIFQETHLT